MAGRPADFSIAASIPTVTTARAPPVATSAKKTLVDEAIGLPGTPTSRVTTSHCLDMNTSAVAAELVGNIPGPSLQLRTMDPDETDERQARRLASETTPVSPWGGPPQQIIIAI